MYDARPSSVPEYFLFRSSYTIPADRSRTLFLRTSAEPSPDFSGEVERSLIAPRKGAPLPPAFPLVAEA